jgi:hypothetical protein
MKRGHVMFVDELIRDGVCEDLEEALSMFPIESIDDFRQARRTKCPGEPTLKNALGRYPRQELPAGEAEGSSRISRL